MGTCLEGGADAANLATRSLLPVKASWTSTLNPDTLSIREKLHSVLSFTQLTIDTGPTSLRQRPDTCYRLHPRDVLPAGDQTPGAVMVSSREEPLMPPAPPLLQGGMIVFWTAAALIIPPQLTHRRRDQTPTRPHHPIRGSVAMQHPPLWVGRHGCPRVPRPRRLSPVSTVHQ